MTRMPMKMTRTAERLSEAGWVVRKSMCRPPMVSSSLPRRVNTLSHAYPSASKHAELEKQRRKGVLWYGFRVKACAGGETNADLVR